MWSVPRPAQSGQFRSPAYCCAAVRGLGRAAFILSVVLTPEERVCPHSYPRGLSHRESDAGYRGEPPARTSTSDRQRRGSECFVDRPLPERERKILANLIEARQGDEAFEVDDR